MSRIARHHAGEALAQRFPGCDVQVEQQPDGGLRIEIRADGRRTVIGISGDEPATALSALLSPRAETNGTSGR